VVSSLQRLSQPINSLWHFVIIFGTRNYVPGLITRERNLADGQVPTFLDNGDGAHSMTSSATEYGWREAAPVVLLPLTGDAWFRFQARVHPRFVIQQA
jgi:hypothetical protein